MQSVSYGQAPFSVFFFDFFSGDGILCKYNKKIVGKAPVVAAVGPLFRVFADIRPTKRRWDGGVQVHGAVLGDRCPVAAYYLRGAPQGTSDKI